MWPTTPRLGRGGGGSCPPRRDMGVPSEDRVHVGSWAALGRYYQHLNDLRDVDHPVERRLIDTDGANFVGGELD